MPQPQNLPASLQSVLSAADVQIGGDRAWDLQVSDHKAFRHLIRAVLSRDSLGFGEAYVQGVWECEALDELFTRLLLVQADRRIGQGGSLRVAYGQLCDQLLNLQSLQRSPTVARRHYNTNPRVYAVMLDPWMQYSCGYWEQATDLSQAG